MPHNSHNSHTGHTGSSGDDLGSTDEVKIFKDEGDREDEKISSENLLEEKSSLIDLTESEEKSGKSASRPDHSPVFGKVEPHASSFNMGYLVSPYSYTNGAGGGLPVSMANKMGLSPFFCHNGDPLTTPPPAHCGIPPYQLDPKAMGLTRPAIYPFPASQYPYSMLSPDMSQVASWHTPSVYSAASSFRSPYPSSLPINTTLSSDFSFRFSPSLLPSVHTPPHHVLNSHPAIVTPGPKQDIHDNSNHRYGRSLDQKNSPSVQADCKDNSNEKKKPHIKKPLNAFMLYMKEMRAKVVAECTLKESAAINQILGRRWHALGREEQAKYYELARRERQLHMQMYPDWSSRTNASRGKKRKRKQDTSDGGNNMKKCRARFGVDQQSQWCKPCRRKKKCIRYMEVEGEENSADLDNHISDDNLGSCGSVDDAKTPDDDTESLNQSLSSPGCLSGLSSLQSPATSLASPLNLLTSPSTPMNNSQDQQQQQQHHQHHQQQQQQHQPHTIFSDNSQNSSNMNNSQQLSNLDRHRKPLGSSISNNNNNNNNNSNNSDLNANGGPNKSAMTSSSTSPSPSISVSSVPSIVTLSGQIKSEKMLHGLGTNTLLTGRLGPLMGLSLNDRTSPQHQQISPMDIITTPSVTSSHPLLCNKSPRTSTTSSIPESADEIARRIQSPTNTRLPHMADDKSTIEKMMSSQRNHHQNTTNTNVQSPAGAFSSDMFFEKAIRNPVGANPRDINNPLSINQLTKRDYTVNTNSPPAIQNQQQPLQPLHHHQHTQNQQHHLHMMNAASPSSTISSSSTSSSSLSSSSSSASTSNDVQTTSTGGYSNSLTTTITSSDGTNHQFCTPALTRSSNTAQQQQNLQQQQQQQQHHHHQQQQQNHQHYQLIASAAAAAASSQQHHQQQQQQQQHNPQHHHHQSLALSQHLQHVSHHFPVVTGGSTPTQANVVPSGLSTKPGTPSIGGPTQTSAHHRSNDGDNGAISVT